MEVHECIFNYKQVFNLWLHLPKPKRGEGLSSISDGRYVLQSLGHVLNKDEACDISMWKE